MIPSSAVILKPKRDKPLRQRHPWVFSGAIASLPSFENGELLPLYSHEKHFLGWGYFNRHSSILGRMVTFTEEDPLHAIERHLQQAIYLRQTLFSPKENNALRLVNGEGDHLPGLILDQYGPAVVMQINTLGMDRLRPFLLRQIDQWVKPQIIYEKSVAPSRVEEGLLPVQHYLREGASPGEMIEVKENGLRFLVSLTEGQKTGFFLDQREMRSWVRSLSAGKRVLNVCCYTGGFSVYAAMGGATHVTSLDISAKALAMVEKHLGLNQCRGGEYVTLQADLFDYLRHTPLDFDLVILDPPAFAKRKSEVVAACRGYKEINRLAMLNMPKGSLLMTFSCSQHVDSTLFRQVLFQAAMEAKRDVRLLGSQRQGADHPLNIFHPEGEYLKGYLLYLE